MTKLATTQVISILVVIMMVQNLMKPMTTKHKKEAPSLTSLSSWPKKREKKTLMPKKREKKTPLQLIEIKSTTTLRKMCLSKFSHTKTLLKMYIIITDSSTIKTLINKTSNLTKTIVINIHTNKINSSLIKIMDNNTLFKIKINSNMIKSSKRATNSKMQVKSNSM